MKRYSTRMAAGVLIGTLALGATPCLAADAPGTARPTSLTRLSPATERLLLQRSESRARLHRQQGATTQESSFLHSRRGAIALTLMAAGAGFAIWSANHDREPVKSPVR